MLKKRKANTSCERMTSSKAAGKLQLQLSLNNLEVGNTPQMSNENEKALESLIMKNIKWGIFRLKKTDICPLKKAL